MPKKRHNRLSDHPFLILKIRRKIPPRALGDFHTTICIHCPPYVSESAAGTSTGNQQKCHEKQQCTYRKNGRNQNPCPQRHCKDPQNTISASSKHSSHTLSLIQYIRFRLVWEQNSRRDFRRLSPNYFRFVLTSHS
jgi:hypothetical protein